jgi:hypothetical protein
MTEKMIVVAFVKVLLWFTLISGENLELILP